MGSPFKSIEMGCLGGWLKVYCILSISQCILSNVPDVFNDYFDSDVKIVDIPQNIAIKACLNQPGPFIVKTNTATRKCLGGDNTFDWNDFSEMNEGSDSSGNGLSNSMETSELCFYTEMGWLEGTRVQKSQILDDFSSLTSGLVEFTADVNRCVSWDGDFSASRKKRSADEEEDSELSMLYGLRRQRRQAVRRPVKKMAKKAKKAFKKLPYQRAGVGGPKAKVAAKGAAKGAKGAKGKGIAKKKKNSNRSYQQNPAYPLLWCVDLAVQKTLKSCVEEVLENS